MPKAQIILLTIAMVAGATALSCGQTYAERANNDDSLPGRYRFVSFTELTGAIIYDDEEAVRRLIADGEDVNEPVIDFMSNMFWDSGKIFPLYVAVDNGNPEIIRMLIDAGADVNNNETLSGTSLHHAVRNDNIEVVRMLIEAGADVQLPNYFAALDEKIVAFTPLYDAKSVEVARMLIEAGADVNATGTDYFPIIGVAHNIVIDVDSPSSSYENTQLFSVVRLLIENGADINATDPDNGSTVLSIIAGACSKCRDGWDYQYPFDPDEEEDNPVFINTHLSAVDYVDELIALGANVNLGSPGNSGGTPLHEAAGTADEDVIMALLRNGAHVNATNNLGNTPLHAAATNGDRESILALLTNGANPNARNIEGLTPLQSLYKSSSRTAWSSRQVRYYEDLANFLWTMSR